MKLNKYYFFLPKNISFSFSAIRQTNKQTKSKEKKNQSTEKNPLKAIHQSVFEGLPAREREAMMDVTMVFGLKIKYVLLYSNAKLKQENICLFVSQ